MTMANTAATTQVASPVIFSVLFSATALSTSQLYIYAPHHGPISGEVGLQPGQGLVQGLGLWYFPPGFGAVSAFVCPSFTPSLIDCSDSTFTIFVLWHQLFFMKSAAISAMAMTVRFGLARTASGMMEASMTRSPCVP